MENLSALVAKVYPGRGREDLEAVQAFGAFMRALSPRVVRNARPVKLTRGTLLVHTANSAWANSLQLESEGVLAKLKRVSPNLRVRRLVFRSGPLPDCALPLPHTPLVVTRRIELKTLPEDLARGLARIHHDALREAVAKAVAVGLSERVEPQPVR